MRMTTSVAALLSRVSSAGSSSNIEKDKDRHHDHQTPGSPPTVPARISRPLSLLTPPAESSPAKSRARRVSVSGHLAVSNRASGRRATGCLASPGRAADHLPPRRLAIPHRAADFCIPLAAGLQSEPACDSSSRLSLTSSGLHSCFYGTDCCLLRG